MTASLEPPSLRRRGEDDQPEQPRGRAHVVAYGLIAVVLLAVIGGVLFAFHSISSNGSHEVVNGPSSVPSVAPAPQLPPAEYDAVETAGRSALSTWARPGAAYKTWWRRLEPLLSSSARTDYAATDTTQLPKLTLLRQATVVPGPSQDTATVYLETTAGKYGVDLTRQSEKAPWRAARFLFPGEKSSLS